VLIYKEKNVPQSPDTLSAGGDVTESQLQILVAALP